MSTLTSRMTPYDLKRKNILTDYYTIDSFHDVKKDISYQDDSKLFCLMAYIRLHFSEITDSVKCHSVDLSYFDCCFMLSEFLLFVQRTDPSVYVYFLEYLRLDFALLPQEYYHFFLLRVSIKKIELCFASDIDEVSKKNITGFVNMESLSCHCLKYVTSINGYWVVSLDAILKASYPNRSRIESFVEWINRIK
jgi:hypothetical protein